MVPSSYQLGTCVTILDLKIEIILRGLAHSLALRLTPRLYYVIMDDFKKVVIEICFRCDAIPRQHLLVRHLCQQVSFAEYLIRIGITPTKSKLADSLVKFTDPNYAHCNDTILVFQNNPLWYQE